MVTVVLLGTLDTKATEYAFVRAQLLAQGCQVVVVDAGVTGSSPAADVSADEVAAAAGWDRSRLAEAGDRGSAMAVMTDGATRVVRELHGAGRLDGIVGLGGSGATSLVSAAMRALPLGVPKLLVSTFAASDLRPFLGTSDIMVMPAVTDVAGINRVSERIYVSAAAAMAGMARAMAAFESSLPARPAVGATMFGVTTRCVNAARAALEDRGYEVLVFHATGIGGQAMEDLARAGVISAVMDATTTELADELVGGVMAAGPGRLEAAGRLGLPQVVSPGALDIVNFGPLGSVPARFRDRRLYRHNAEVTLMRTSEAECAELGRIMARKLNAATGPVTVFIPAGGLSALDVPDGPFWDPIADAALRRELRAGLRTDIRVVELTTDINDPDFARAMAERLDEQIRSLAARGGGDRPEEVLDETPIAAAASAAH